MARSSVSATNGRKEPVALSGGRNRPALITVLRADWDELHMELQVLRREAIELVDLTLPAARHLEVLAHDHGPTAWQLAVTLVDCLNNYKRRFV